MDKFKMVKMDNYAKRQISDNISFLKGVDSIIYYPYRKARVSGLFMSINRDTSVGKELYEGLLKLFDTDGDNHHCYGLFDKYDHPIMYIWFEDQKILFGKSIMIID